MASALHRTDTGTVHYLLLDGLRGVAALMVLGYHLFEAVAFAAGDSEQQMFHGFLAVDFFLILSGFVMGHAYDHRWDAMTVRQFFRRRLVRLHPMVVLGVALGVAVFCMQGRMPWDGTAAVSWGTLAVGALFALFLLPVGAALDCRGNAEMFPLNGPHWSLFFEYLFNILYALLLRRLPSNALKIWVAVDGIALFAYAMLVGDGNIAMGWSSEPQNMFGGLLRVGFDYPMGLLLARMFRHRQPAPIQARYVFVALAAMLCLLLCVPNIRHLNATYELICVAFFFPCLVWNGARATIVRRPRIYTFLADLSYPLYAIHYPLVYLYIGWINAGVMPFGPYAWCTPAALFAISAILALVVARCYDQPVRRWLRTLYNQRS